MPEDEFIAILTSVEFKTGDEVDVTVTNLGTTDVRFSDFKINGVDVSHPPKTIKDGNSYTFTFDYVWSAGNTYTVELITNNGDSFKLTKVA
jgi:archaellum component FlaF (FlaF/FlaG flagellin family)